MEGCPSQAPSGSKPTEGRRKVWAAKAPFLGTKNTGNRTMSKEMEFRNEMEKKERRIRNNLRKGQSLSIPSKWAMQIFEGYREKEENEYKCPPRGPSSHFPSFSSRFLSLSLSASIALLTSVHVSEGKSPLENPPSRHGAHPSPSLPFLCQERPPSLSPSLQGCHAERGEELGPRLSLLRSRRRGVVAPCAARRLPATFALSSSAASSLRCCLFRSEGKEDTVCVCASIAVGLIFGPLPTPSVLTSAVGRAGRGGVTHIGGKGREGGRPSASFPFPFLCLFGQRARHCKGGLVLLGLLPAHIPYL